MPLPMFMVLSFPAVRDALLQRGEASCLERERKTNEEMKSHMVFIPQLHQRIYSMLVISRLRNGAESSCLNLQPRGAYLKPLEGKGREQKRCHSTQTKLVYTHTHVHTINKTIFKMAYIHNRIVIYYKECDCVIFC